MLVNMLGRAFVTTKVHNQTDIAAKGPEMDRSEVGKISEEIIHGRPLAPKLHIPPKIIMKAVAALPPETVEADFGAVRLGLLTAM
jgi:hypothetical protein